MTMTTDEAIRCYIRLRDLKKQTEDKHKQELEPITSNMLKLENWLQGQLLAQGAESVKSAHGTAFFSTSASATVKSWPETLTWIKENQEWDFLEARVNKTAVKGFIESTGEIPPGVDYREFTKVVVRR
jgi:hypothetical protein